MDMCFDAQLDQKIWDGIYGCPLLGQRSTKKKKISSGNQNPDQKTRERKKRIDLDTIIGHKV